MSQKNELQNIDLYLGVSEFIDSREIFGEVLQMPQHIGSHLPTPTARLFHQERAHFPSFHL